MKARAEFSTQLNGRGPNRTPRRPPLRGAFLAMVVGAIAAAFCLQSSCVSIGTPRAGQPVVLKPGQALVFGRIVMLAAKNENIKYSPFKFDPWDEPFFVTGPRMTLELRQHFPPGGAFKYKSHPAAPIETDGAFFWILSAGDYELLGNPRLLGSERFTEAETGTLARFSVPTTGGTIYVGTLIIGIDFDLVDYILAWKNDEAEYRIQSLRVVDERERELSKLRERFPALPEPVVTDYMRTE